MLELSQIFASVSFNSKIGNKEFMGIMHTQGFLFLKRMSNVADHSEYTEIPTLERLHVSMCMCQSLCTGGQ